MSTTFLQSHRIVAGVAILLLAGAVIYLWVVEREPPTGLSLLLMAAMVGASLLFWKGSKHTEN